MSKETALSNYTRTTLAIKEHIKEHSDVFGAHERLLGAQLDADNALRDAVQMEGAGCEDGTFKVTITPQTQTVYDETKILGRLGITREQAVSEGLISDNERPPRIQITPVGRV